MSRVNNKKENADPKCVRYDYMTKNELLDVARNSAKVMKYWRQKCQRLDEYRGQMAMVGKKTDSDLQSIFKSMYNGIFEKKQVLKDPVCKWTGCGENCENVELLYEHAKQHIEHIDVHGKHVTRTIVN